MQKKRIKYVAQPDSDEEKTKSKDINQFRVVSHPSKSTIDKICENIKNADLNDLKSLDFNKLSREEKNKVEELVYAMTVEFKNTPLELEIPCLGNYMR